MEYYLKIIKKDGDVSKHYFSSYEDLDYNSTFCQFSANIVKAIGMKVGLFRNKILFEIGWSVKSRNNNYRNKWNNLL